MSRRGIEGGTLALPWPSSSQRSRRRIGTDASVLAATVVLALVGLVMVFSASAVLAGNRFHDSIYFLKRQVVWLAFGFLLLHLASRVDYTLWRRLAWPILGLTVVLLILVLVPSLGVSAKGARRWLRLGLISMQPAELAKLGLVAYHLGRGWANLNTGHARPGRGRRRSRRRRRRRWLVVGRRDERQMQPRLVG